MNNGSMKAVGVIPHKREVALLEHSGFQAVLMVPLVFGGRDVGLLELYRRHALPWSSAEIERAQLLAHQLAAVLDLLDRLPDGG